MTGTAKRTIAASLAALVATTVLACVASRRSSGPSGTPPDAGPSTGEVSIYAHKQARITTRYGDMVARFFPDIAPKTVKNFCDLAQKGFYNGVVFHRVIPNFMIQGGDPQGTGLGGPGYTIDDEFSNHPHTRGTLSMAHAAAPHTGGSQFFIVHGAHAAHLDGKYSAFGELTAGLDVLDKIAAGPCNGDRPIDPIRMDKVVIEDRKD